MGVTLREAVHFWLLSGVDVFGGTGRGEGGSASSLSMGLPPPSPPPPLVPCPTLAASGCDALATSLIIIPYCAMIQLGHWRTMVMCCSVMVPFFLAQWEETVTHILRTNVGGLGAVVSLAHNLSCVARAAQAHSACTHGLPLVSLCLY